MFLANIITVACYHQFYHERTFQQYNGFEVIYLSSNLKKGVTVLISFLVEKHIRVTPGDKKKRRLQSLTNNKIGFLRSMFQLGSELYHSNDTR